MMFVAAAAEYFKYKLVSSVIVLACWDNFASLKLTRELNHHGLKSTVSCDPGILLQINRLQFQGVLIFSEGNNSFLDKVKTKQFTHWYKWLVVGDEIPNNFSKNRYDVDVSLLNFNSSNRAHVTTRDNTTSIAKYDSLIQIQDAYVHPRDGISLHSWATWSKTAGLLVNSTHDIDRIRRRQDLKMYPISIVTPVGFYTPESSNNQTFIEYLRDITTPEKDSAIRVAYALSTLIMEAVQATAVLQKCLLWYPIENHNSSMVNMIVNGEGDITGGILRLLPKRASTMDIITYIWPLSCGFVFIADRDSSSNMFVKPLSPGVWWCCLGIGLIMALAQRITANAPIEKDSACMSVIASWLQQDSLAGPESLSGKWTFVIVSISSMLVHAYYTSSIVSSFMNTGNSGPKDLRELADSTYSITSENYDWMRHYFFDVKSGWDDMEYLVRKKKTSKFYQDIEVGMEMVRQGGIAYHAEYNHVYPYLRTFSDEQICKLNKLDTVPEMMTWLQATKQGQWTETFHIAAAWLHETGLSQHLLSIYQTRQPECRATLLAERVKLGDILPLILFITAGAGFSVLLLGLEIMFAKWNKSQGVKRSGLLREFPE